MRRGQAGPGIVETRVYQDPATAPKQLGPEPFIHPTAKVRDSRFGAYCEVGARTKVAESSFGDYSYVVNDADIIYSEIGRFCSIAAQTRINPGNHPLDRVALNHFTYRSRPTGWARTTPPSSTGGGRIA